MKKFLASILVAALSMPIAAHAQAVPTVESVTAGCAADGGNCVALVQSFIAQARLAGTLTPQVITALTTSIAQAGLPSAVSAAAVREIASAAGPGQANAIQQIAQTLEAGGTFNTASIGGAGASAL